MYILTMVDNASGGNVSTTTIAVIRPNGVIRDFQRKYVVPGRNEITLVVSFQYTDIGSTKVEVPPWYEAAKNATAKE
ncbi:MAG: hypothetical protein ABEH65_01790 [Halobacteriales archaeon]